MARYKRTFILWGMVYLAMTFMAVLIYTEKEKKYRKETSRNAFWNAVRLEKETGIRDVVFRYRQDHSPNDLTGKEKRNWCDQAFLLFIAHEDFFISHTDIGRLYDGKEPTAMSKDKAYHTIKQLKGLVAALGIGIHSVRGKGYRMAFPTAEDHPSAVRPPEAENPL